MADIGSIETSAVVADRQPDHGSIGGECDLYGTGIGMFRDIGHGLLRDTENGQLPVGGQPRKSILHRKLDRKPGAF